MAARSRTRILVVDDQADFRALLREVLAGAGFDVVEAATGADALRAVAGDPALVILDVRLPDLSGVEVCRRIKADPARAATLVLMVSALHASSDDRAQGLESGADAYLRKPVELRELLATVRALLRLRQAEENLAERARQAALAADVAEALTQRTPLQPMLQRCADAIVRHLGAARAAIWTREADGDALELAASAGVASLLDGGPRGVPLDALEIGRVAEARRPRVTNALADAPWVGDPEWVRREGMVAFAGYPLVVGGRLVGALATLARRPLSDDALAALDAVARTIALGIDRRRAEEAIGAVQEETTARILASTLDLPKVLEQVCAVTRTALGLDFVRVWLRDGDAERVTVAAEVGVTRTVLPQPRSLAFGQGLVGTAAATGRTLAVDDLVADPRVVGREFLVAEGIVSFIAVPLVVESRSVGVLGCSSRSPREWSAEEIGRAERIARHAALALQNARLFRESEERRRTAEALAAIGRTLSETLDPSVVGRRIVETLLHLLDVEVSRLFRRDPASGALVAIAHASSSSSFDSAMLPVFPEGTALIGVAVRERAVVTSADVLSDPRVVYTPEQRERVARTGLPAVLAVPLIAQGEVIGAITVGGRAGRTFGPGEIRLAQAFADQAAVALENARLYERQAEQMRRVERMSREVMESARAKEDFLLSVSHELGTPLTAVKACVDTLAADPELAPESRREFLAILQTEIDRLARLIGNLLDVSRLELGQLDFHMEPADLDRLAASVAAQLGARRRVVYRSPGPLPVKGDADRLTQVLVNLVDNAIKFSPPDTALVLEGLRGRGEATIRVLDRGRGIPEGRVERLFQKFERLREGGRGPRGSGLGLYLSSEIVRAHGGTIGVERREGGGSIFWITLPLAMEAP